MYSSICSGGTDGSRRSKGTGFVSTSRQRWNSCWICWRVA